MLTVVNEMFGVAKIVQVCIHFTTSSFFFITSKLTKPISVIRFKLVNRYDLVRFDYTRKKKRIVLLSDCNIRVTFKGPLEVQPESVE